MQGVQTLARPNQKYLSVEVVSGAAPTAPPPHARTFSLFPTITLPQSSAKLLLLVLTSHLSDPWIWSGIACALDYRRPASREYASPALPPVGGLSERHRSAHCRAFR